MKAFVKKQFIITGIMLAITSLCFAQTQTKITQDSLPAATHNELHIKYAAYTVNSVLKITDEQKNTTYKVEIQKKTTQIELLYNKDGKLISKDKSKIYTYDGTEKVKSKPSPSNDGHGGHQH